MRAKKVLMILLIRQLALDAWLGRVWFLLMAAKGAYFTAKSLK